MCPQPIEELAIPDDLLAMRFTSEEEIIAWENRLLSFFIPNSDLFTPFPQYFRIRCYEFRVLRQLLPGYLGVGVNYARGLEIGCGFGFKSLLLAHLCDHLLGIDVPFHYESHVRGDYGSSVEVAKIIVNEKFRVRNVSFQSMMPDHLEIASNSISFVFSEYTLEHIPDLAQAIKEMYRVMAKDGIMIHVVPNTKDAMIQFMNAQINFTPREFLAFLWRKLRGAKRMPFTISWNGTIVPQCHSEFLDHYAKQIEVYTLENYLFPMLDAGFKIEQVVSTREHNSVIVARK